MAFRGVKLLRMVRSVGIIRCNIISTSVTVPNEEKFTKVKEFKTESNFAYLEDPDTFGTLTGKIKINDELEDEGDIKEQKFLEDLPLPTQRLTIKQYADLIKQYLKHKRLKEAIDVMEVRMLTQDRVKPDNYIFNILIGACADVGYTKKAFKLYNDMKRRGLQPTGDTYTCLFQACINSPWTLDGLKRTQHLRELMNEKGIEPNLTNYNVMIKAFGRCGDLPTAFKIVDEMISKKIKIRVHTLNHLLHACIADKNTGLRHALVVWRKLLKMKERPNIYSFNLMLKCVKECNLGSKEDVEELIYLIHEQTPLAINSREQKKLHITSDENSTLSVQEVTKSLAAPVDNQNENVTQESGTDLAIVNNDVTLHFVETPNKLLPKTDERTVPNLLSRVLRMRQVMSLQEIANVQDKFALIGGQDDFLKEMESFGVPPDIKTFTQMLPLLEETREAENKLLETMKSLKVVADIDFYNMLIKNRCFRSDYAGAFEVREIIKKDSKKRNPLKKKLKLKVNIMTYGVLAIACENKESAEKLLGEMKEERIKVNIEILSTLLRQGTARFNFGYVHYIMDMVKQENLKANDKIMKHLEMFNDKCGNIIQQKDENGKRKCDDWFYNAYKKHLTVYSKWLKEINAQEALEPEHPWQQFRENYPETVQRPNFQIEQPKRFLKRSRKFVKYTPRI